MHFLLWTRHVGFPLALGGLLYVLQFAWPGLIPTWIMYYLPDALWAYALVSAVLMIWSERRQSRRIWVTIAFLCGPLLEYLQWRHLVPGQGDLLDVLVFLSGGALAVLAQMRWRKGELKQLQTVAGNALSAVTIAFFLLTALATSRDLNESVVPINMEFTFTDDKLIMQNLNRFALLDWSLSLNDVRRITYFADGISVAGLAKDTILFTELTSTSGNIPLERDSLARLDFICTIIEGKLGRYTESLD